MLALPIHNLGFVFRVAKRRNRGRITFPVAPMTGHLFDFCGEDGSFYSKYFLFLIGSNSPANNQLALTKYGTRLRISAVKEHQ